MSSVPTAPAISIIIPVYNTGGYLRRCLDSLKKQTFADFEAICVDDGSTDESPQLLDEYGAADARFRIIHQVNGGVSVARNTALDAARAPYVTMLDSDDWLAEDALLAMYEAVQRSGSDMVSMERTMIYADGKKEVSVTKVYGRTLCGVYPVSLSVIKPLNVCISQKLLRRDIIEQQGLRFLPGLIVGEDSLFLYQYLLYCNNIHFLTAPLYHKLESETSVLRKHTAGALPLRVYDAHLSMLCKAADFVENDTAAGKERKQIILAFLMMRFLGASRYIPQVIRVKPEAEQAELRRNSRRYRRRLRASLSPWFLLRAYTGHAVTVLLLHPVVCRIKHLLRR